MEGGFSATGFVQRVPGNVDRVPEFDPRAGEHLWTISLTYRVDPAKFTPEGAGDGPALLDLENLLLTVGPGCFYCERIYTPLLATRRCPGEPRG